MQSKLIQWIIQTKQATLPVSQTQNNTHFLCLPNKHVPFQLKTANTFSQTYTRSNSRPFSTLCPTSVNQSAGTTWANRAPVEKEEGEEGSGIFSTWPWRHIFATNQALFLWEYLLKGSLGKMSGITKKGGKTGKSLIPVRSYLIWVQTRLWLCISVPQNRLRSTWNRRRVLE